MEKIKNINQLKPGTHFFIVRGDEITGYEYLCVHPHNETYILALNSFTQEGEKHYIPQLLKGEVYVGNYDTKFFTELRIKYYKREIERLEQRLKDEL